MNLLKLFRRTPAPEPVSPARELASMGSCARREFVRWRVNQMRAEMGMPPMKLGKR